MTNYPSPPTPPGPFGYAHGAYPTNPSDALAPARRAATMLWILGGFGILCGICITAAIWIVPAEALLKRFQETMTAEQRNQLGNIDLVKVARIVVTVLSVLEMVLAGILLATAAFVRRGSRAATVTAIIPCALLLLWSLLLLLINLVAMATGSAPLTGIVDVFIWAALALASGFALLWLFQALGASGRVAQQQLFAAQYWHQQQQQHPTGYGYGSPTPPPSSPTPQQWMTPPPPPTTAPPATFTPPPPPPPVDSTDQGPHDPNT